jgi:hypothetical protein
MGILVAVMRRGGCATLRRAIAAEQWIEVRRIARSAPIEWPRHLETFPGKRVEPFHYLITSLFVTGNVWLNDVLGWFAVAVKFDSKQTETPYATAALDSHAVTQSEIGSIHQLFDEVLQSHISDTKVNYPGIADDARFVDYIKQLEIRLAS